MLTFFKIILFSFVILPALSAEQYIYISSTDPQKPSLEVHQVNSTNGDLSLIQTLNLKRKPGVSSVSPDGNFLYLFLSANKKSKKPSAIVTYAINSKGILQEQAEVNANSRYIFISVDPKGEFIFGVSKSGLSSHKLSKGICTQDAVATASVGMIPHSVKMGPQGQNVYVPHIRSNMVFQYHFNRKTEAFEALKPPTVAGPDNSQNFHDPRHLAFNSKHKVLYTSNELGGGISSWKRSEKDGTLTLWQTKPTIPQDFNWVAKASDICVSNDNLFAYVANRDNTDSKSPTGKDSIAIFALDPKTGSLSQCLGRANTGRHVRSLLIDKTGNFLYATGTWSADISIYQRNPKTGLLKLIKKQKCGQSPMWISLVSKNS